MTGEEVTCECGWKLPLSVFAYPVGVLPAEHAHIPKSYVALVCPVCEHGHAFYHDLADITEEVRANAR